MEAITAAEFRKMKSAKKSKYNNKKVEYMGDIFDSKKELNRWKELKIMENCGEIKNLSRQIEFELIPKSKGQRSIKYIADFAYDELYSTVAETALWNKIYEDCKGYKTAIYKLKKKLMRAQFGIVIRES